MQVLVHSVQNNFHKKTIREMQICLRQDQSFLCSGL